MKKIILALLGVAALLVFVSCGSKPKDEDAEKPTAPEDTETEIVEDSVDPDAESNNSKELYEQVLAAKKKIDDEGLASYDQKNYDAGVAALSELEELMANKGSEADKTAKGKEALGKFKVVINAAYKKFAKEEREAAYQAKKNADSVKAGVAEKEKYKKAAKDFQDGDSLFSMQSTEKAYNKYVSAKEVFTELYETVSEKRKEAAAALEAAKARVSASENMAKKADSTAPITEDNVDGIEDEDKQLLDDDKFDNPENAVVDIPEDIDVED